MSAYVYRGSASVAESANWSRRRNALVNLRTVMGRAYPRVIGAMREPSWVFFEVLLPMLATSAFVFVYRALAAPEEYIGFVVIGGALAAFWLNVVWLMAAQLYWEKDQGNLELYFSAPINMMSILVGMAIGGMFMTLTRAAVILIGGTLIFGVSYHVTDPLLLVAVFVLTVVALYGLGMLLASLFLMWGREAYHLTQLLQEPIYFLGGLNVPVRALGPIAGVVIATLPLAVGLDAMRQLAFVGGETAGMLPPWVETLILLGMAVVLITVAHRALKFLERLARREGRLTVRWQ
ncbi:MAG: ABC transporter permease [Candidatus Limnocylindria bacterium]